MCYGSDIRVSGTGAVAGWKVRNKFYDTIIGIAAGGRNAYVLAMNSIKQDEIKKKRTQEDEIQQKVERYNKTHKDNN